MLKYFVGLVVVNSTYLLIFVEEQKTILLNRRAKTEEILFLMCNINKTPLVKLNEKKMLPSDNI
jgi:hypothetical protein